MKTSKNNTPIFRRNFLALIAGTTGTLGITTSFGNSPHAPGCNGARATVEIVLGHRL